MARFLIYKASLSKQVATAFKKIIPSSIGVIMLALLPHLPIQEPKKLRLNPTLGYLPPLEMKGGDPYIRALMRTISASEANDLEHYSSIENNSLTGRLSQVYRKMLLEELKATR